MAWTTASGAGSQFFDTSVDALKDRLGFYAKANGLPDGAPVAAAFKKLQEPGGEFHITEGYIRTDDGTTHAPHLRGPEGKGQKYRYFDNGPQVLGDVFAHNCARFNAKDFVVYDGPDAKGGMERYSFERSYELASNLAFWLTTEMGLQQGERVSHLMRNYPEWIHSFMGATCVGLVAVPTNSLWVGAEIQYGLNDSGARVCFVDGPRAAQVLPLCRAGKLPQLKAVVVSRDPNNIAASGGGDVKVFLLEDVLAACVDRPMPKVSVPPESNAIIMYTSGTTSAPKGVVSTHRNVVQSLRGAFFYGAHAKLIAQAGGAPARKPAPKNGAKSKPRANAVLCPVPLFHATGTHAIFLLSVMIGRKLVLMPKWDASKALQLIERERVSAFTGVPTMSMELLNHPDYAKYDLSTLKSLGGGGAAPPKKLSAMTKKAGKSAGQGWGLTESNAITVQTMSSAEYVANPSSCGRAVALIDIKVIDVDTGEEQPPDTPGEIVIRGVPLMKEYWNKREKTVESVSTDGWFRSGDIGRLDHTGALYIMDRAKDLIIRGGENISCAEVESAIYEHPAVAECAVFAVPDERLGEKVAAAIVRKPGAPAFTGAEMVAFTKERIARFKAPAVIFLWEEGEQLPRGATGKIPKRTIRDQINAGTAKCAQIFPPMARM